MLLSSAYYKGYRRGSQGGMSPVQLKIKTDTWNKINMFFLWKKCFNLLFEQNNKKIKDKYKAM